PVARRPRSAVCRSPRHGLERRLLVLVEPQANDLAVAQGEDLGAVHGDGHPLPRPRQPPVWDDHVGSDLDELLRADVELLEDLEPPLDQPERTQPPPSTVSASCQPTT